MNNKLVAPVLTGIELYNYSYNKGTFYGKFASSSQIAWTHYTSDTTLTVNLGDHVFTINDTPTVDNIYFMRYFTSENSSSFTITAYSGQWVGVLSVGSLSQFHHAALLVDKHNNIIGGLGDPASTDSNPVAGYIELSGLDLS